MSNPQDQNPSGSSKFLHYGMMICCAVMLLPVGAFFIAGGTIVGLWTNVALFAPIALCLGAHVLMFKLMGKSCHRPQSEETTQVNTNSKNTELHSGQVLIQGPANSR